MTHAFGFSEQEYLISFETDEPGEFLALAEEMRHTSASKMSLRGMPIYTCRKEKSVEVSRFAWLVQSSKFNVQSLRSES